MAVIHDRINVSITEHFMSVNTTITTNKCDYQARLDQLNKIDLINKNFTSQLKDVRTMSANLTSQLKDTTTNLNTIVSSMMDAMSENIASK